MYISSIWKKLLANISCFLLLFLYSLFGGVAFLYFEREKSLEEWDKLIERKFDCIDFILRRWFFKFGKILNLKKIGMD
ncbi:unnamed protein product [Meloidogyne enterolobii]|uniref:Uncharacterized protein n=1 Tax=Meloidogyne enterolobii TaxID=390850 RepID=A0ACB1ADW5_MELEN